MFHNILVCVDGSRHAERALDEAIDLAEAGHGRLMILTAIPRPPYWACLPITAAGLEPLVADLEREATAVLRAATARVPKSIPVTTILSDKPIREILSKRIKTGEHDLLVMGSRGRRALSASVLGSVSHFALNHSDVPVLIIHMPDEPGCVSEDSPVARSAPAASAPAASAPAAPAPAAPAPAAPAPAVAAPAGGSRLSDVLG